MSRRRVVVQTRDEPRSRVRKCDPPSREREADLAGVQVPGQDQVESTARDLPTIPGKWQRRA